MSWGGEWRRSHRRADTFVVGIVDGVYKRAIGRRWEMVAKAGLGEAVNPSCPIKEAKKPRQ